MSSVASAPIALRLQPWAGAVGIVGGFALAGAYLTHPPSAPPDTVANALWIWVHVGFMISLLGGVFLLMALFSRYAANGGGMAGFVGFALAVVSLIFVFGLDYAEVFIFPTMAVEFPAVVETYGDGTMMPSVAFAFPLTGIAYVIGFILFSWELMRCGTIGRLTGWLTIAGTLVFGIGLSGLAPMIVVRVGSAIFGAGLIALGLSLLKSDHEERKLA